MQHSGLFLANIGRSIVFYAIFPFRTLHLFEPQHVEAETGGDPEEEEEIVCGLISRPQRFFLHRAPGAARGTSTHDSDPPGLRVSLLVSFRKKRALTASTARTGRAASGLRTAFGTVPFAAARARQDPRNPPAHPENTAASH